MQNLKDWLYENPNLYEDAYTNGGAEYVLRLLKTHCDEMPRSLLDIGCGTGRDTFHFSKHIPDCVGIDYLDEMARYAQSKYPGIQYSQGDMREFKLNRKFEALVGLGACINYMNSNEDLDKAFENFRAHSLPGTILILQPFNPCNFMGQFRATTDFKISTKQINATGKATYQWDYEAQTLARERIWTVEGQEEQIVDTNLLRIIYPQELTYILTKNGFEVKALDWYGKGGVYGDIIYVVACFEG